MADPAPSLPRRPYVDILDERRDAVRGQLRAIFPEGPAVFDWEVGCGHGHFLTAYAAAHPGRVCLGVDMESSRIERATKKRDRARLPNLHFIRAEARLFLQTLPATARLSRVFILFPDPWPKSRHHKHRLLQPEFLEALARSASPDARLYFRTDHEEYFAEAHRAAATAAGWEIVPEAWPFEHATVFQSRAPSYQSFVARRRLPVGH